MDFTLTFLKLFYVVVILAAPLLIFLLAVIIILGQIAGRQEGWSPGTSLYWTFITATTVGYGDIPPTHRRSRILSVIIAIIGLMLTGLLVAIALASANNAFDKHIGTTNLVKEIESRFESR